MNPTERFYKIDHLLRKCRNVSFAQLQEALEVSPATLKRDLMYLRDRLNAPIIFDRERRAYRYDPTRMADSKFALPGVWFNASEIHALLTMQALLTEVRPGLLGPHIAPLQERLESMIGSQQDTPCEIARRIRIVHAAKRMDNFQFFDVIASATLKRHRMVIRHWNRKRDETVDREVSPQRLVFYRDNWYLDAFCHLRGEIRSFGLDAIKSVSATDVRADEIGKDELDAILGAGYGIFSGADVQWATLRFSPERARWVRGEQWHPQQRAHLAADGSYTLQIPYSHPAELIMDILRHGSHVEVMAPTQLRQQVAEELLAAAQAYVRSNAQPGEHGVASGAITGNAQAAHDTLLPCVPVFTQHDRPCAAL